MKKLSLLLTLILTLTCLPAMAAEGDVILGREEGREIRFDNAFTDGEVLYLSDGARLYTWQPGDAELTEHTYSFGDSAGSITAMPFIGDGQLYAFTVKMSYGAHTDLDEAALNKIALEADGTVSFERLTTLDWTSLLEYYDEDVYANMPLDIVARGGKAYLRHYNDQYDYVISVLDLETGRMEENYDLQDVYAMVPYQEGTLLVEQYSFSSPDTARFLLYDYESDSVQTLGEFEVQSYTALNGLAYDEAADIVYCIKDGEICPVDPRTGEVGAGVSDMPLESYGSSHAVLLNNGVYAYAGSGLAIRDLVAGSQVAFRLRVVDSNYCTAVTTATTRFGAEHSDVGVTLSRDFRGADNLVESMMNRDDSVDIYTVSTSSAAFDAVYKRGYMMELDRSEAIADLAERMYPSLRERLSAYDHFVALPLETYCWGPGLNEKALEALGLTLEDVPDNWWDFLDFLPTLAGPLAEHENVRLTYQGQTVSGIRSDLFYTIFNAYQSYVNVVDPNMGYNTPLLRGLLEKVERIDFEALGCEEDYGEDSGVGIVIEMGGDTMTLFETAVNYTVGESYSDAMPVMMGLDADTRAPMILDTVVAFVNPFTRHPDEALAYMEALEASMSNNTRYNVDPALDEPIRGARNEELLEESRQALEQLRAQLESADPSEAQLLEERVAEFEEHLAEMEQYWWEVPESSIAWYRAHADGVVTAPVNWLYADNDGEGYELIQQYLTGSMGLDELLREIDHKVQMMLLEGN